MGDGAGQGLAERVAVGFFADAAHQQDVVVGAQRHGEDEQQDRDEEQHAVVVGEVGEGDGGEAERGHVGQADAGDEVDGCGQAAQQDREQDADDGQYQRHDGVEVGGGVVADVV